MADKLFTLHIVILNHPGALPDAAEQPLVTGRNGSSPVTRHNSRYEWTRESHKLFLGSAACDCTCECWGNAGIPLHMREVPNRFPFPRVPHRINVLTRILSPCIASRYLRVERAMGIEPTGKALPGL